MSGADDEVDLPAAARAIEAFLQALGHPVTSDPELASTGARVAEAFHRDLLEGYRSDPAAILADACASPPGPGSLVMVQDIATTAMCPHHLLPAPGVVHLAYAPGERLAGLGALGTLVQAFARRLILQETLAQNVAEALVTHLGARAAACAADLQPTCVTARGGRQHAARATSIAFAGDADELFRRAFIDRLP